MAFTRTVGTPSTSGAALLIPVTASVQSLSFASSETARTRA